MTRGLEAALADTLETREIGPMPILLNEEIPHLFNTYLEIPIHPYPFECPFFCLHEILNVLDTDINMAVVNLPERKYPYSNYKSIDTLLRDAINSGTSMELRRFTFKDETFLIGPGIMLNENYHPVFMTTVTIDKEESKLYNPCIYVDMDTFTKQKTQLDKTIVKKLIPYYLENTVTWGNYTFDYYIVSDIPDIKITRLDNIVHRSSFDRRIRTTLLPLECLQYMSSCITPSFKALCMS